MSIFIEFTFCCQITVFDEVWVQPRATSYDEKSIRCLVKIIDD